MSVISTYCLYHIFNEAIFLLQSISVTCHSKQSLAMLLTTKINSKKSNKLTKKKQITTTKTTYNTYA